MVYAVFLQFLTEILIVNDHVLFGLLPVHDAWRAGALGMLYFFILAHQADFDVKWCRGTTGEMIFKPWVERIESMGSKVLVGK